jgi:RNA polymerase sigma factor (sigma-70 family)
MEHALPNSRHETQARRRDVHLLRSREVDAIYSQYSGDLRRIVRSNLTLTDDVLDDACQFAWSTLLIAGPSLAKGVELRWLVTTATREALRLLRRNRSETEWSELPFANTHSDPTLESVELRGRLAEVARLPARQQQFVWLHGLGYEYTEISAATGATTRTVERQLMKARRNLRSSARPVML